jgi:membrane fusion protein, multidrug efflux system
MCSFIARSVEDGNRDDQAHRPGENKMIKRMVFMLAVTTSILAALGLLKYQQVQEAIAKNAAFRPAPAAVTTIVTRQEKWPDTFNAIGTVTAVQGVVIGADLPGIVDKIEFESGDSVSAGAVLVKLDIRQEQAQLAAAEAARDLAQLNFKRLEGVINQGAISQLDFDKAAADQKQTEAKVQEILATIARKTVCAPFSGILGIRQVNLGQYLTGGAPIVSLQKLDPIYVDFAVPQQYLVKIRVGSDVRIKSADLKGAQRSGRVTAIDSVVDADTRNVQIQTTIPNPDAKLRPGMFAETEVWLGSSASIIALPAPAISYAPYGDSVFIITDLKDTNGRSYRGVRQQFVTLGAARGDQVAVISGLKAGEEVVSSGTFKLRNGTAVLVNNNIRPSNEKAPKPEDK